MNSSMDNCPGISELTAGPSSTPLNVKSSSIHPRSAFMQALIAPYPELTTATTSTSGDSNASTSDESVYYSGSESELEEHITPGSSSSSTSDPAIWGKPLYKPTGIWRGTETSPLVVLEDTPLSEGAASTVSLRKGRITLEAEEYEFPCICKTIPKSGDMDGFIRELALYKNQLRPLQGEVVPRLINIYPSPGELDILFEPPHPSFWIEATADMPEVLKERVIDAFDRIHSRGVFHNDVELRHMLIGGDGRVTLIDFEKSKTNLEFPELRLKRASRDQVREEMRKVKVKLNYQNARAEEEALRLEAARQSSEDEDVSSESPRPRIRVVSEQEWKEKWIGRSASPRRFVMPGQSAEELQTAIQKFVNDIDRLERDRTTTQGELTTPPSSPKLPSRESLSLPPPISISSSRKRRKVDDPSSSRSSKRRHVKVEEPFIPITKVPATAVELPLQHSVTSTALLPRLTSPLPPPPTGTSNLSHDSCSTSSLVPLERKRKRDDDYEDDLPDERPTKTIQTGGDMIGSISTNDSYDSISLGTTSSANSSHSMVTRTQPWRRKSPEHVLEQKERRSRNWARRVLGFFGYL